jgi:hypothetical protein
MIAMSSTIIDPRAGKAYTILAVDSHRNTMTHFLKPFTMTVTYSDQDWQEGKIEEESHLNVYWLKGQSWIGLLPCTICQHDQQSNQFVITLNRLSEFSLLADERPPTRRIYLPVVSRE